MKKAKEVAFTLKDAVGTIRVVHVQLQHFQEGKKDHVKVIATSDGVPVEATARVSAAAHVKVKTKSRLS
ncbi:hypothetical protein HY251_19190 [bacterium]|nr:hypothetical protein [bacterium]